MQNNIDNQYVNNTQQNVSSDTSNLYETNIENTRVTQNIDSLNTNPYINNAQTNVLNTQDVQNNPLNLSTFNTGDFVKGALIGAAVTYLLTNKGAQENIMKAVSKGSELFQAGMEEMKERMEDAKAAMDANK